MCNTAVGWVWQPRGHRQARKKCAGVEQGKRWLWHECRLCDGWFKLSRMHESLIIAMHLHTPFKTLLVLCGISPCVLTVHPSKLIRLGRPRPFYDCAHTPSCPSMAQANRIGFPALTFFSHGVCSTLPTSLCNAPDSPQLASRTPPLQKCALSRAPSSPEPTSPSLNPSPAQVVVKVPTSASNNSHRRRASLMLLLVQLAWWLPVWVL
jgi:hypothetical protein